MDMNTAHHHQHHPNRVPAVVRGITARRPLRQEMTLQQTSDHNGTEEREITHVYSPSVWEQVASWSRHYLHIPLSVKIPYYVVTLLMFSAVHAYVDLPTVEALTGKQSVINQVFAKKSWGITLAVFSLYRAVSLFLRPKLRVHLKQVVLISSVTTFFYFFWCKLVFPVVDYFTSSCIVGNETLALAKRECEGKAGGEYLSFDVSGHSFLLTYCVLVMMEESKEILYFLWLGPCLFGEAAQDGTEDTDHPKLDEKEVKSLRRRFPWLSPLVVVSFLIMCAMALLWDFMVVITTLYYHSFAEKAAGSGASFLAWGLVYKAAVPWLSQLKVFGS